MLRKRLMNLLKIAFGLGTLLWIARGLRPSELLVLARQGNPLHLWVGVGCLLIAMMYFQWTRLHLLMKGYAVSVKTSMKIFYIGALFNNLLPGNIGGDAIRLIYLKNLKADNWGTPFMLMLLYRLSGLFVLVAAGLVYIGIEHARLLALLQAQHLLIELSTTTWLLGLGGLVLGAIAAVLVLRRLSEKLRERAYGFLRNCSAAFAMLSLRDRFALVLHTVLLHVFRMLAFYYLVMYLGQHVGMWDLVFVISATAVASVLPITVAGLGIMEGSISGLLTMYGVDGSAAVAVALVNRAVLLLLAAIGGVVYVATRAEREPAATVPSKEAP